MTEWADCEPGDIGRPDLGVPGWDPTAEKCEHDAMLDAAAEGSVLAQAEMDRLGEVFSLTPAMGAPLCREEIVGYEPGEMAVGAADLQRLAATLRRWADDADAARLSKTPWEEEPDLWLSFDLDHLARFSGAARRGADLLAGLPENFSDSDGLRATIFAENVKLARMTCMASNAEGHEALAAERENVMDAVETMETALVGIAEAYAEALKEAADEAERRAEQLWDEAWSCDREGDPGGYLDAACEELG